jgi:hypothetical protein
MQDKVTHRLANTLVARNKAYSTILCSLFRSAYEQDDDEFD